VSIKLSNKIILTFLLGLVMCALLASAMLMRPLLAPTLQSAVFIPKPKELSSFTLKNHQNKLFSNRDLVGHWTMISYGYTFCPDICPTTLASLVRVDQLISKDKETDGLAMMFYTIDPQRDTAEKLAQYLAFFSANFIGLTLLTKEKSQGFEKSLGIVTKITTIENSKEGGYSVAHGVMLYLLNPLGQLQAVFKPHVTKEGLKFFNSELVYSDYKTIRRYVENENPSS